MKDTPKYILCSLTVCNKWSYIVVMYSNNTDSKWRLIRHKASNSSMGIKDECQRCFSMYKMFNQMPNLVPEWAGYEAYQMLSIVLVL